MSHVSRQRWLQLDRLLQAVNTVSGIRVLLLLEVASTPLSTADVAEALGLNTNTAYRALGRLWRLGVTEAADRIQLTRRGGPRITLWRLKEPTFTRDRCLEG